MPLRAKLRPKDLLFIAVHTSVIAVGIAMVFVETDGPVAGILVLVFFVYGAAITPYAMGLGRRLVSDETARENQDDL